MSARINIGGQVIVIPTSGTDANWAQGVSSAFIAIANQLASIASQFDISPRVQILTSDANTNLDVSGAVFPSGSVRSFSFTYAIYRTNGVTALAEDGIVNGVYNDLTSVWTLDHNFEGERQVSGLPYHTFAMSGDQLQISTTAIGGAYDNVNSKLSYGAKTVLTTDL